MSKITKYNNSQIYKIVNDINSEVYIGSTCQTILKRFNKHISNCKNESKKHRPLYKLMNEIGKDKFSISLVEEYPCSNKSELLTREGYWIREFGTLNSNIAGRSNKECLQNYYIKNAEKICSQTKEYRRLNDERISERISCECGCKVRRDNISNHKKTKKHIDLMNNINI